LDLNLKFEVSGENDLILKFWVTWISPLSVIW